MESSCFELKRVSVGETVVRVLFQRANLSGLGQKSREGLADMNSLYKVDPVDLDTRNLAHLLLVLVA